MKHERTSHLPRVPAGFPCAESEQDAWASLERLLQAQAGGGGKATLRYIRVTCSPLDAENHAGATKALTDCIRSAFPDIMPDDSPEFVSIVHEQIRCKTREEEGTWIELIAAPAGDGESVSSPAPSAAIS